MDSLRFFDFAPTATSLIFGIGWPPESTMAGNRLDLFNLPSLSPSTPKVEITDTNGLFGCNILLQKTRNFKAAGKTAEISIPLKVKVDVEIDGVGEDREETVGALVGFVSKVGAGRSNPSAEWIKSLRPVVFRCESDELLPGDELLVTAPAGFLYELKGEEYCQMPQTFAMAYSNLSERTFRLSGTVVSEEALDREVSIAHQFSVAMDVAKFICFGLKFVTPAGDPKTDPNSQTRVGQNEYTYADETQTDRSL